ncbi:putative DNA oxidative demethylase [Dioscorea sansibarensis]
MCLGTHVFFQGYTRKENSKSCLHGIPLCFPTLLIAMSLVGFVRINPNPNGGSDGGSRTIDLGNGSEVFYVPRFLSPDRSWEWFRYLDKEIPWTRPLVQVFGRSCVQTIINGLKILGLFLSYLDLSSNFLSIMAVSGALSSDFFESSTKLCPMASGQLSLGSPVRSFYIR